MSRPLSVAVHAFLVVVVLVLLFTVYEVVVVQMEFWYGGGGAVQRLWFCGCEEVVMFSVFGLLGAASRV